MSLRLKNAAAALDSTNLTSVYTCPTNFTARIKEVWVTNIDGSSAANITLKWTDTSASATYSIISTYTVPADDALRIENANIMLEAGDILKAQAAVANDLEVSVFIEEEITLAS